MKSKKAELQKAPRYEEYHLEKLRRRYLFRQLWGMVSVSTGRRWDCVISDDEIEPHVRNRRDVVIDLLRDEMLEPLDTIQTRSPKVYGISDNCVQGVQEFTPPPGYVLDLGISTVAKSWADIAPSKELWAAASALAEGSAGLVLEETGTFQRLLVEFHIPEHGTIESIELPDPDPVEGASPGATET